MISDEAPDPALTEVKSQRRSLKEVVTSPVSEDLASGQIVIGTARWILVVAGLLLALWNPAGLGELRVEIAVILILAVANFYLYTQILTDRASLNLVVSGASAADLAVVTLLILAVGASTSGLYIFYFPAILALAVAFRTDVTAVYTGATILVYAMIALNGPTESASADRVVLIRVLMLTGVAVCGSVFRHIERSRRLAGAESSGDREASRTEAQEELEDVFFGQRVIIWARWFIIVAGAIYALTAATTTQEITAHILPVVVLLAINFFLHGRYLVEKPANRALVVAASLVDLILVSMIVATWQGRNGLDNFLFVLYYPILVAFAFVMPRRLTAAYTLLNLIVYGAVCVGSNPAIVGDAADLKSLVMRLITLAAVGGLGTFYWRIQRNRRRAVVAGSQNNVPVKPRVSPAVGIG
jgi:hypothetical protein